MLLGVLAIDECVLKGVRNRFLSQKIADKYELDMPEYQGLDQIVEVGVEGQKL